VRIGPKRWRDKPPAPVETAAPIEYDRDEALRSCNGKKQYRTFEHAGQIAALRRKGREGYRGELRVYECVICGSFHLTSVSLERFVEKRAAR
jgi:hypothetical protein